MVANAHQTKSTLLPPPPTVILNLPYIPAIGSAQLHDPLFCAAEMRAKGYDWNRTANELKLDCEVLRGLALDRPEVWERLLRGADREYACDTGREATNTLRMLMRSEEEKIRLAAATRHLVHLANILRFTPAEKRDFSSDSPYSIFAGMSNEQLEQFIADHDPRYAARFGIKTETDGPSDEGMTGDPVPNLPRDPQGGGDCANEKEGVDEQDRGARIEDRGEEVNDEQERGDENTNVAQRSALVFSITTRSVVPQSPNPPRDPQGGGDCANEKRGVDEQDRGTRIEGKK